MSGTEDKIRGKVEETTGEIKQGVGDLTGDESLEAEGFMDRAKGKARQALGEAKETIDDAVDNVKDVFDGDDDKNKNTS